MTRLVIEIEDGWRFVAPDFLPIKSVTVYEKAERWPTQRQKPVVKIVAVENTLEAAAEQLRLYFAYQAQEASNA